MSDRLYLLGDGEDAECNVVDAGAALIALLGVDKSMNAPEHTQTKMMASGGT